MSIYCDYCRTVTHSSTSCPYKLKYDPVARMWNKHWTNLKLFALQLMDELPIIKPGDPMLITNEVEPLHIEFERLPTEPDPVGRTVLFVASLMASHSIR